MITVDLVTGFLGAGKTTFIKKYVEYLKKNGNTVRVIENEFGAESVDSHLLEDECEVSDLAGLCMCCVGKDAFIKILVQSADAGCDRIIVEPSGIYDVDEFFEVMSLSQVAYKCEIGNIITIVDLMELEYLLDEARYLLFTQLIASGIVVVSKRDLIGEKACQDGMLALDELMKEYGCEAGVLSDVIEADLNSLCDEAFDQIADSAYSRIIHDRQEFVHSEVFESSLVSANFCDEADIREKLEMVFSSPSCGRVYRIKGFKRTLDDRIYEINATADAIFVKKSIVNEEMLVVIGQNLRIDEIESKLTSIQ